MSRSVSTQQCSTLSGLVGCDMSLCYAMQLAYMFAEHLAVPWWSHRYLQLIYTSIHLWIGRYRPAHKTLCGLLEESAAPRLLERCWNDAGMMLERCWNDAALAKGRICCSSIVRQEGCHIVGGLDLLLESVSPGGSSSSAPCVETVAKVRQSHRRRLQICRRRFQICREYPMQQCIQTTLRACLIDDLWEIK